MHHVLTIPELVRVIVDEAGYGLLCPNAPTLVALALTCRGFLEPALDVLWSKQYRLDNLVKCLPEAIWIIPSGSPKTLTLSEPTRPTTQQDWDRFDFYAKRIRALEFDSLFLHKTGTRTLSKSLFRWLFSSRPSYHPLPTLTSLIWHGAESSEIRDYAHLLFGRQLSRLSIDTCSSMDSNSQTSEVPALLHLPERSPDIQELRLTTRRGFSVQPITGKFFASLKRLKFLTMESTMTEIPDILIGLSTLQNLTTVSLELSGRHRVGTSQKDEDRTGSGVVFRTLTKLTLRTATMSDANDILKTCRCPQLQLINVHGGTAQSADLEALNTMIRLINKHCVPTVLEAIEISAGEADEGTQVVQHITAASLRPLYDFHRLRSLHVISGADMYIILDDDSIEEMARSWPRIESLALWSDAATPWTTQTAMTLEGLVHLARYCPSLETLQIDVNTTGTTVSPLAKPGGGHYNRVLRELLAPRSHASGEPAYIAAFLYAIFPNLECINQGEDTDQVGEVRLIAHTIIALRNHHKPARRPSSPSVPITRPPPSTCLHPTLSRPTSIKNPSTSSSGLPGRSRTTISLPTAFSHSNTGRVNHRPIVPSAPLSNHPRCPPFFVTANATQPFRPACTGSTCTIGSSSAAMARNGTRTRGSAACDDAQA